MNPRTYRVCGGVVLGTYLSIITACVGCSPNQSAVSTPKTPEPVHDVGWTVMIRDFATADIYTNRRVRIRLEKRDYTATDNEVRVWLNIGISEPVIVCHTWGTLPKDEGRGILIEGRSLGPVRDGKWRSPRVDYCVRIEDCVITAR